MDVNEKIVNEWLNLCKNRFTIQDIKFKVYGLKGGSNYSNIDILATDGKNYYDYEVKWTSAYGTPNTENGLKELREVVSQIYREGRKEKIKEYTNGESSQHFVVLSRNRFTKDDSYVKKLFNENDIIVLYFEDVVKELADKIGLKGRYDSEISQIIRMLKLHGIINSK